MLTGCCEWLAARELQGLHGVVKICENSEQHNATASKVACSRLAAMLSEHCQPGMYAKVSVEVYIENGHIQRMTPAASEVVKLSR